VNIKLLTNCSHLFVTSGSRKVALIWYHCMMLIAAYNVNLALCLCVSVIFNTAQQISIRMASLRVVRLATV